MVQQRYIFLTVAAVASVFVQKFLVSRLGIGGFGLSIPLVPDVALIVLVYFAQQTGQESGTAAGFFTGVLLDLLSGILGVNAFAKTVGGFIGGYFDGEEERESLQSFLVALGIAGFFHNFFWVLLASSLTEPVWRLALVYGLLGSAYHLLLAYPLYFLLKRL